ncbi:IS66 family insertion sequence element accessory protein TnpB [Providencia vermicola]|uniref:IS66 family insertion sequence element accessory protein TnpB n=1 Tax=Providencia vermicola TaxID=333965 RepID=UPI0034DCE341
MRWIRLVSLGSFSAIVLLDKLKILFWDTNGFWLYYRRLEKGTFKWPRPSEDGAIHITKQQLGWLLSGLTLEHAKLIVHFII